MGSDAVIRDFSDNVQALFYAFDTTSEIKEAEAEEFIKDFCAQNSRFSYESKAIKREEFTSFVNMFVVLGGVLCAIIAFIGILNFSNTVIASILTRKNEIAVLQAIGMTGKQVSSMLVSEGLMYSVGSGGISFTLSLLFIPVVFKLASGFSYYSNFFSVVPVLIALPIMAILGIAVPILTYRKLAKESIIDRIREISC
jgi:putative ABC transport system permease protein